MAQTMMQRSLLKSAHALDARGSVAACAVGLLAVTALVSASPAVAARAASTASQASVRQDLAKLGISVPASARVQGTTPSAANTTTADGAQPGTVAPGSAVPGSAVTSTATQPSATTSTPSATGTSAVPSATTTIPATTAATGAPPASTRVATAHRRAHRSKRLSSTAIVLAALGALLLLACLTWAAARWLALEPRWTGSLTHSLREASDRASATWAEFSDWARIGY